MLKLEDKSNAVSISGVRVLCLVNKFWVIMIDQDLGENMGTKPVLK